MTRSIHRCNDVVNGVHTRTSDGGKYLHFFFFFICTRARCDDTRLLYTRVIELGHANHRHSSTTSVIITRLISSAANNSPFMILHSYNRYAYMCIHMHRFFYGAPKKRLLRVKYALVWRGPWLKLTLRKAGASKITEPWAALFCPSAGAASHNTTASIKKKLKRS